MADKLWLVAAIAVCSCLSLTDGLAVMSVDLGSEFMKVAIVKPGVPMEIVLNKESRRKTPVVVSMRNGERLFSDPAMTTGVRYPKAAYLYLQDLLAKGLDNPVVKRYMQRFPHYELAEDPETNTVYFKHSEEEKFTPEELLAMVLEHAKEIAEKFAEQPVYDAVITVPPYFNQAERRAMVRAGEMAGIKVLQIMNDNTAVALNYGIFRRKSFNTTAVHYMFFDMGATSTSATVVAYQESKIKNKVTGITDKTPQLTIKGVGFDRNLGGLELQLRLRDHLAKLFNDQKKTSLDVTENGRAMAKLFKEAGRLKHVLSANTDHYAQIESLLDDQDFKAKVTREEYETMCADVFNRIDRVVKDALRSSEVTMDEINEVILMGGSTRIPKVQENLQKAIGREDLGKSINTDEAAALGAVYQAAHLSKGFKVKKFAIKEATLYPIQVEFERAKLPDGEEPEKKMVTRTLFGRNNPYPQNKVMTFNKHTKDFGFEVNYGVLDYLTEEELQSFGNLNLYKVSLSGVEEAYGKHKDEAEPKGIKAHFKMEDSGILELDKVEFVLEKQPPKEDEKPVQEKSTLEKIGNAFGSLFGSPSEPPAEDKDAGIEENEIKADNDTMTGETQPPQKNEAEKKPEEKTGEDDKETAGDQKEEEEGDKSDKEEEENVAEETAEETDKDAEEAGSEPEKETEDSSPPESEMPGEKEEQKEADEKEEKQDTEKQEEAKEDEQKPEEKAEEKEDEKKGEKEEKKDDDKKKKKGKKDKKNTKEGDKDKKEEKKDEKPKATTIKAEIKSVVDILDTKEPSKEAIRESKKKIKDLKKKDEEKALLEKAKNDLETFTIDAQDKLYQDDYIACSTDAEREEFGAKLSEASDWIYEQEEDAKKEIFIEKLKELKKMTKKLWERVRERQERPRAIEALNGMVNYSENFLLNMKNFTGEEPGEQPFTKVEYETLEKLIVETKEWNATIMEEQAKTPDTEAPKLLLEDVAVKVQALDRELKYLTNKAKTFKPKVKKEDKNDTKTDANATKTETKEEIVIEKDKDSKPEDDSKTQEDIKEGEEVELPPVQEEEGQSKEEKKEQDKQEEETLQLEGDTKVEGDKQDKETVQPDAEEDKSSTSDDKASEDKKESESKPSADSEKQTTDDSKTDSDTVTHDAQDL